jgi:hypothetical protein
MACGLRYSDIDTAHLAANWLLSWVIAVAGRRPRGRWQLVWCVAVAVVGVVGGGSRSASASATCAVTCGCDLLVLVQPGVCSSQ